MKKKLFGLLISLALIVGFSQSAYAVVTTPPTMKNWGFDVSGTGNNKVNILSYVDILTSNFIDIDTNTNTFTNSGLMDSDKTDGTNDHPSNTQVSGTFDFSGSLVSATELTFDAGGVFELYVGGTNGIQGANSGTHIATFTIKEGDAFITSPDNGAITIVYDVEILQSGYFFMPGGSVDMYDYAGPLTAFTTTNAAVLEEDEMLAAVKALLDPTNAYIEGEDLLLTSNGQFQFSAVPVPPALILFGSGLVGLFGISRRKKS